MVHLIMLAGVVLAILGVNFFAWGLAKIASKPIPEIKPESGRKRVNTGTGRRTYAEGRPTMPSRRESYVEYERRKR